MVKLSNFITYDQLKSYIKPIGRLKQDVIGNFNNTTVEGTKHPIHYYILTELKESDADAIYDVMNNKWIKKPKLVSDNYIEKKFPEVYKEADRIAKSLDMKIGDIKRNILDYKYLNNQLNLTDKRDQVLEYIQDKLNSIDSDLKTLLSEFDIIRSKRKEVFTSDPDKLKETWEDSPNWSPSNITFKLLEKWQYATLIDAIKKVYKNDVSEEEKIEQVSSLLKLANTVAVEGDGIPDKPIYVKCLEAAFTISVESGTENNIGSGFLISKDGYALTCAHVINSRLQAPVDTSARMTGSFDGINPAPLEVIAINYDIDAALIKIDNTSGFEPLKLGNVGNYSIGDPIVAVGSPMGIQDIATTGIIASSIRNLQEEVEQEPLSAPIFFMDVNISPGSSGGMVVSEVTGEVIGLARGSVLDEADPNNSLNYVIAIDTIKNWLYSIDEVHFTEDKVKLASNSIKIGSFVSPKDKYLEEYEECETPFLKDLVDGGVPVGKVLDIVKDKCLVAFDSSNIVIKKNKLTCCGDSSNTKDKKTNTHISINRDKKTLEVLRNDKVIFKCKISTGAPEAPSYGGNHHVIDKEACPFEEYFDQYLPFWIGFNKFYNEDDKKGCYQGIHAIPLDKNKNQIKDKIGEENSHGCIRLLYDDAKKLYKIVKVKDSIEVI